MMNILYFVILIYKKELRDEALKDGNNVLNIVGKQYKSKYNECKNRIYSNVS